ncbi:outer membrane protein [Catalinimonas alkaloidigena]|uniref:TolC family protein n=1 Tax=Catalinimonas alkaloidigena TaxID=1075417 RepID=UPI0024072FFD|nr:TolC family protein [Catalinimonas alkaloidigena]MDF9797422.1 outer membrane protein [Catalinimonas alkaloidigena]
MSIRISALALIFTFFFSLIAKAQEENLVLTYEEAVNIALRENIQIKQQENILETSRAERSEAFANLAPNVSFNATGQRIYGRQFDQTSGDFTDEQVNRLNGGLSANITLFNGFRIINTIKQRQHAAESQLYQINQTKQDVVFNVSQQYLQVLLNQELLRIAKANLEQQNELAESIRIFVEAGTRNIADQYNQEAEAKRAALTVVESDNQLKISRVQLIRLLQIDPFKDWIFSEPALSQAELLQENISLEQTYNTAIANRPDIRQQETSIEANKYGLKAMRGLYYPRLILGYELYSQYSDLEVRYGFSEQLFDINQSQVLYLNLSIPIFNNLSTKTQVQRSKQLLNNSMLDMEDLERNIFEQVQTAIADYETAQERIVAAEAQVRAAEKALEAEKERFRLGVGNILDLTRVNAAYVEALSTKAQADYQIIFQKAALEYYKGKLQ